MPLISVKLDTESDALMQALATKEHRSKREQMAVSALAHARSILPNFRPARPAKKGGPRK
jgi:predicted transcriptional regulator